MNLDEAERNRRFANTRRKKAKKHAKRNARMKDRTDNSRFDSPSRRKRAARYRAKGTSGELFS